MPAAVLHRDEVIPNKVLAPSEKAYVESGHCISRFNHLVQLRDSGRVPVTKANAITAFKPEETGKNRNEATVR